ncbi:hypothetical protein C8Q76DRAFT_788618 [Earliella scabrosa]|nr:hypothetical protein C8Q76DRAFT_788618 [Earliella scabrosa]
MLQSPRSAKEYALATQHPPRGAQGFSTSGESTIIDSDNVTCFLSISGWSVSCQWSWAVQQRIMLRNLGGVEAMPGWADARSSPTVLRVLTQKKMESAPPTDRTPLSLRKVVHRIEQCRRRGLLPARHTSKRSRASQSNADGFSGAMHLYPPSSDYPFSSVPIPYPSLQSAIFSHNERAPMIVCPRSCYQLVPARRSGSSNHVWNPPELLVPGEKLVKPHADRCIACQSSTGYSEADSVEQRAPIEGRLARGRLEVSGSLMSIRVARSRKARIQMSDCCGISDCRWVPAVHATVYIAERRWRCGCDLSQALLVPRTKTGEHQADAGPSEAAIRRSSWQLKPLLNVHAAGGHITYEHRQRPPTCCSVGGDIFPWSTLRGPRPMILEKRGAGRSSLRARRGNPDQRSAPGSQDRAKLELEHQELCFVGPLELAGQHSEEDGGRFCGDRVRDGARRANRRSNAASRFRSREIAIRFTVKRVMQIRMVDIIRSECVDTACKVTYRGREKMGNKTQTWMASESVGANTNNREQRRASAENRQDGRSAIVDDYGSWMDGWMDIWTMDE